MADDTLRIFDGIIGWSNKRAGVEFYHSWEDGRWGRRPAHYAEGEPERGGWGHLLADHIEIDLRHAEGRPVLVIVGERSQSVADLRVALAAAETPGHPLAVPGGWGDLLPAAETPGLDVERERARIADVIAASAHFSGEVQDCDGEEGKAWCGACLAEAEDMVAPDSTWDVVSRAREYRAALPSTDPHMDADRNEGAPT